MLFGFCGRVARLTGLDGRADPRPRCKRAAEGGVGRRYKFSPENPFRTSCPDRLPRTALAMSLAEGYKRDRPIHMESRMFAAAKSRRRWGDNDHYFGPFTFAFRERWRHFAVLLASGEEDYPGANLRVSAFGNTVIVSVPNWLIRPHVSWVDLSDREWATPGPDGRTGYVQIDRREYGFTLSDGHLSVKLGRQTHDSSTTQDWGCFLPWTTWRHVRHSFYGLDGEHVATLPDTGKSYVGDPGRFERKRAVAKATPTASFEFADYDGERIVATTKIEEREWRLGEGRFKWLSLFRRPKIRRSLDIEFSAETGQRKGSWKGGTLGTGIDMLPGELHEAAFRRYCAANDMTFIGPRVDA